MTDTKDTRTQEERVIARTAWVNDLTTASYEWRVVRADGTSLEEFDPENVEGERVLHLISEWPGAPKPLSLGVHKVLDPRTGKGVDQELFMQVYVATVGFDAYDLHAVPMTLDHQDLPDLKVRIESDMAPIWGHRNRSNDHGREETMFFGRRLADGTEELTLIYPDGVSYAHTSFEKALGHVHEPTFPKPALEPEVETEPPALA